MISLSLPLHTPRPLPFYLAMEEWAARRLPAGDYFFAWRVQPTVICGRNQDIAAEVDLDYCRRKGIRVVRRRSGGGAVYADMQNLMFSYITPGDSVVSTFSRYTSMISAMLRGLGLDAAATGRNDILVGGRKVSGNAFYHLPGRCIVHGTMLYDLDPEPLAKALTPSRAKLESKKVKSVPMRVTCLKDCGIAMGIAEFERYAVGHLTDAERAVTEAEIKEIEALEQAYYDPAFLRCSAREEEEDCLERSMAVPGVGELTARYTLTSDRRLKSLSLSGDFFVTGDLDAAICRPLAGTPYTRKCLEEAIAGIDPGAVAGLTRRSLLDLLI